MAGAPVDICNLALGVIGDHNISDLTEQSEEARTCSRFYEPVRRSTLLLHDWRFATGTITLPQTEFSPNEDPLGKWVFKFMIPVDCLRVRRIQKRFNEGCDIPFSVGISDGVNVMYCNYDHPTIEYTIDVIDTKLFSPAFEQAFYYRLASSISLPLTQSSTVVQMVEQRASIGVASAIASDANESREHPRRFASWTLARL